MTASFHFWLALNLSNSKLIYFCQHIISFCIVILINVVFLYETSQYDKCLVNTVDIVLYDELQNYILKLLPHLPGAMC